jgi:tetratricopeptide (TPR) repeat protein
MKTIARILGAALVIVSAAIAGGNKQAEEAMKAYKAANFDKAIELFSKLAADPAIPNKEKKDILLYLGRAYTAKGKNEKAYEAMTQLLELEPPLITPDPDAECPPLMKIYYEARKKKTGTPEVERPDPGIKTIAVLDFLNRSVDDKEKFDPMQGGFADLMIGQLSGSVQLKIVERERIQWLLDEVGMQNDPTKFDAQSAVRVGKMLGAHVVLLGSFIKVKSRLELLCRLVKVETSEIISAEKERGDEDDFFEIVEKLSLKVAKNVNASLTSADIEKSKETKSLDAILAYSDGLLLVEKGNYKDAYDKFMKAFELDPSYDKAKKKAESIKPLVG